MQADGRLRKLSTLHRPLPSVLDRLFARSQKVPRSPQKVPSTPQSRDRADPPKRPPLLAKRDRLRSWSQTPQLRTRSSLLKTPQRPESGAIAGFSGDPLRSKARAGRVTRVCDPFSRWSLAPHWRPYRSLRKVDTVDLPGFACWLGVSGLCRRLGLVGFSPLVCWLHSVVGGLPPLVSGFRVRAVHIAGAPEDSGCRARDMTLSLCERGCSLSRSGAVCVCGWLADSVECPALARVSVFGVAGGLFAGSFAGLVRVVMEWPAGRDALPRADARPLVRVTSARRA
jgi:hypothetical protein